VTKLRLAVGVASLVLAGAAYGAADKPFVDCNREELIQAAPEMSALEFASSQEALEPLLETFGQRLKEMLAAFVNVSIGEDVHEMRFDRANLMWAERREKFRYIMQTAPPAEFRRQPEGLQALLPDRRSGFLVAGPFLKLFNEFLPENRNKLRFRYLGRIVFPDSRQVAAAPFALVVAFAARDESRQGLLWLDETTKRIVRLRSDVLKRPEGGVFDSFSTDARFQPVSFPALESTLWLPASAVISVRFAKGAIHAVHRFSDYRVDGFEHDTDADQVKEDTGEPAVAGTMDEDAFEILMKGVSALQAEKPAAALAWLQEAAARLPERLELEFYLGLALQRTGDFNGAETKFADVTKRFPDFASAHNELGVLLFQRSDTVGAVAQFREAVRLEPSSANLRANLDAALKKLGSDNVPAVVSPSAASEVTIKVDVRQVLVPVVVTDREGHHVTGLKQSDFKLFEDSVEQKISAFASERVDMPSPENAGGGADQQASAATDGPKPLARRHVYIICIDTMHASFGNFVHVREALQRLFQQEHAGDSQYAVIGLGRSMQIIQNTTSDPAKALAALAGPDFRKTFLQGQQGSSQIELDRFERTLQEVRNMCDSPDRSDQAQCRSRKPMLPSEADRLAESTALNLTQFLGQLRSVVEQLARGNGRRTLVLISDGFNSMPGKPAYELMSAYFPELPALRGLERVQDALESIFKLAVKGNVPIYTIDSRGLYTSPAFDVSRGGLLPSVAPRVNRALDNIATDDGMTLSEIAAATGGTAFHNSNDLGAGLKRAFADGREYYMLAYVPSNSTQDGKFRKIEVQVVDKKASVSAKRGYWASP
jgi:VWFA-related protein